MGEIKCDHIEDKLERHLEIYAQNNKELALLRQTVENNGKIIQEMSNSLRPLTELYISFGWSKKFIFGIIMFISLVIGLILSIKQVLK